jgi:hypothetical protein
MTGFYDKIKVVSLDNTTKLYENILKTNEMLQNGWRILNTSTFQNGFLIMMVHTNPKANHFH